MNVDVVTEITLRRPKDEVAAFASDPSNAPRWYQNIKSVEWVSQPPVQVSSRMAFVAHFLGRRIAYTYEVTEFVPGERLVMRTAEGPFPMETTYTWEATDDGHTHMTLRNRGTPSGFSVLLAPFVSMAVRRENRRDLEALKRLLESPAPAGT
jgi:uncharacterized membrane protein